MTTHKSIPTAKEILILLGLIIVVAFAGYLAGKYENSIDEATITDVVQAQQKAIDSLETVHYRQIIDSLMFENKVWQKAYNSISKFKTETKADINATNKKINNIADDNVQRYVDSLRRSTGFN